MFGINNNASDPAVASVPGPDGLSHTHPAPPMPTGVEEPVATPPLPPPDMSMPAPLMPTPQAPVVSTPPASSPADDNLMQIKQQALQSLAPLVDHLDQTPEEKFKTTMMMLQASDNPALVEDAYAAANAISDEKIRAQALLDVVNEINYFTQHKKD